MSALVSELGRDGAQYQGQYGWDLSGLSDGSYKIRVTLAPTNSLAESNENNNVFEKSFTVKRGSSTSKPNLTPYTPSGWSDKLVIATVAKSTTDSSSFTTNDAIYASAAYTKVGAVAAGAFKTTLTLKNSYETVVKTLTITSDAGLSARSCGSLIGSSSWNFGKLATGQYTLTMKVDAENSVAESNENDNTYSRTFTVTSASTKLSTPTLSVSAKTASSLSVEVGYVANASSYKLVWATDSRFTQKVGEKSVWSAGTYTLSDLKADTTYYVRVQAVGNGTSYADSEWKEISEKTTSIPKIDPISATLAAAGETVAIDWLAEGFEKGGAYTYVGTGKPDWLSLALTDGSGGFVGLGTKELTLLLGSGSELNLLATASKNTSPYPRSWTMTVKTNGADFTTISFTQQGVQTLAAPTLSVSDVGDTSFNVAIGSVTNAIGHTLEYATNLSFSGAKSKSVDNGSFMLDGLNANTRYYVRVKAEDTGDYNDSNWSSTQSTITSQAAQKLATPSLTVRSQFGGKIAVINAGYVNNASGYSLEYATNSSFIGATPLADAALDGRMFNLPLSDANATYYFRVKAEETGNYADSNWSSVATVTTAAKLQAPGLTVSAKSSSSLNVTVGRVVGASGYALQYATNASFSGAVSRNVSAGTRFTLDGLAANAMCFVRVKATGITNFNSDWSPTRVAVPRAFAAFASEPFPNFAERQPLVLGGQAERDEFFAQSVVERFAPRFERLVGGAVRRGAID
ncbi:MAG: hypothetical protein J6K20_14270 [Thermoguttaceae bacterium]|nr:hypothetical protein [Thermoguttaceae bacterium]